MISKLSEDLNQILLAGAPMAASSTELARHREELARLGQKVPALGKLAEAAARATSASHKEVAREVLNLAQMTRTVRAAQATAATAATGRRLEAGPPIGSPCDHARVWTLHDYLADPAEHEGGWRAVEKAAESGHLADVRLIDALLAATYKYIGDELATRILPPFGPIIATAIRQRLDVKQGDSTHACWLRLICNLDGDARDLLSQALLEGSPEVREAALTCVAEKYPGDSRLVPDVLTAIAIDDRWQLRELAVPALTGATSAEAVKALLEIFTSESGPELAPEIGEALAKSSRANAPLVAARLMKTKPPSLMKHLVRALLSMGVPEEPRLTAFLRRLAGRIDEDDNEVVAPAVDAAFALGERFSLAKLAPVFDADRSDDAVAEWRFAEVAESLERHPHLATEAWRKLLLTVVEKDPSLMRRLAPVFGALRERRALPLLIAAVKQNGDDDARWYSIAALGELGDPAAFEVILARVGKPNERWSVMEKALRNLPGAVLRLKKVKQTPRIRELQKILKSPPQEG